MCAAIGFMLIRKFHVPTAAVIWIWVTGGSIALMGVLAPSVIRPFYLVLIRVTYPIGWCVSHLMLAVMYFLVLTPIGFLLRRFHDPMERRFEPETSSYWVPVETMESERYFHQL